MTPMKAALYVRVSTKPRKRRGRLTGQTVENQRLKLSKFAEAMDWPVVACFSDSESGSKADRPGFLALMNAAARHEFDVVLVWSLDRFTREGIGATCRYLDTLAGYKIKFRSFCEPFLDTTSEFGDLVTAIFAFFAKFERKRIGERVKIGMERARRQGKHVGRPYTHRIPTPELTKQARAMGKKNVPIRRIAAQLGLSHGTAQRLANCNDPH